MKDGDRLRAYLKENKISRTQAAKDLGYTRGEAVSRLLGMDIFGKKIREKLTNVYRFDFNSPYVYGANKTKPSSLRLCSDMFNNGELTQKEFEECKSAALLNAKLDVIRGLGSLFDKGFLDKESLDSQVARIMQDLK